ncbi:MAG: aminotransferase class V-fold PLP-dependent enzyme, partial [Pseudomonadales bacterium]
GSTLLALLRSGDHIVSSAFLFGNTNSLLNTLQNFGVEVTFVDATESKNVEQAIQPNTKLVFVETIANPVTQVADLKNIGAICEQNNLLYFVDNTLTTPHLFSPKSVKASLIINSLTKAIGGHGNALGGCVTDTGLYDWTKFSNIYDSYKNAKPALWGITQVRKKGLRDFGAAIAPEAAHHIAVGAETLSMRIDKACHNAFTLAQLCQQHKAVENVYYPGLEDHPQHESAKHFFKAFGGLFSIDLVDGVDCFDFLNKLELVASSSNLGDNRSLGIPVAHTIYYEMGPERRASMGIADSMLRFSIGIEDTEDLVQDFTRALDLVCAQ